MLAHRSAVASLSAVVVVAGCLLAAIGQAGQSTPQLPMEPPKDSGLSVTGAFEGWFRNPDGTHSLLVGYYNRNRAEELDIPIGPNNRIDPGGPDQGQPTHFLPRRQWGVFTVIVPKDFGEKRLTWTLVANGQTTVVPLTLHRDYVVEPFEDKAMGNTPPVVRFEPDGPTLKGPPRGIAASFSAIVPEPLTLTLWATDTPAKIVDEAAAAAARRATTPPRPPITVLWSKFRGPGAVTFGPPTPEVDKADGKATTTATFAAAGEYILRAQVNDSSGDGGGGNQCCWTNAHVKVTVAEGKK